MGSMGEKLGWKGRVALRIANMCYPSGLDQYPGEHQSGRLRVALRVERILGVLDLGVRAGVPTVGLGSVLTACGSPRPPAVATATETHHSVPPGEGGIVIGPTPTEGVVLTEEVAPTPVSLVFIGGAGGGGEKVTIMVGGTSATPDAEEREALRLKDWAEIQKELLLPQVLAAIPEREREGLVAFGYTPQGGVDRGDVAVYRINEEGEGKIISIAFYDRRTGGTVVLGSEKFFSEEGLEVVGEMGQYFLARRVVEGGIGFAIPKIDENGNLVIERESFWPEYQLDPERGEWGPVDWRGFLEERTGGTITLETPPEREIDSESLRQAVMAAVAWQTAQLRPDSPERPQVEIKIDESGKAHFEPPATSTPEPTATPTPEPTKTPTPEPTSAPDLIPKDSLIVELNESLAKDLHSLSEREKGQKWFEKYGAGEIIQAMDPESDKLKEIYERFFDGDWKHPVWQETDYHGLGIYTITTGEGKPSLHSAVGLFYGLISIDDLPGKVVNFGERRGITPKAYYLVLQIRPGKNLTPEENPEAFIAVKIGTYLYQGEVNSSGLGVGILEGGDIHLHVVNRKLEKGKIWRGIDCWKPEELSEVFGLEKGSLVLVHGRAEEKGEFSASGIFIISSGEPPEEKKGKFNFFLD